MRSLARYLVDHPSAVTVVLLLAVVTQAIIASFWVPEISLANWFSCLTPSDARGAVTNVALGTASVAAMVGGFAGVVVVFGLSSDDERFRTVRLKAATSLRRNWMSVVTTPLLAAFGALIAAALGASGRTATGLWVLEVCILLAAHGAIRLVVVLFELVKVVQASDESTQQAIDTADTDDFLGD